MSRISPAQVPIDRISILMREYDRMCVDIRNIEGFNDRLLSLGLTLLGAGISYGLISDNVEVFIVLPVLMTALFTYSTLNLRNINFMGGYKRVLEEKINMIAGEKLLVWEAIVHARPWPNVMAISMMLTYLIIFLAITFLSVQKVWVAFPPDSGSLVAYYLIFLLLVMLSLLLLSVRKMNAAFDYGRELANKMYGDDLKG